MSQGLDQDDVVDIALRLGALTISVSGPSSQASRLVADIADRHFPGPSSRPATSSAAASPSLRLSSQGSAAPGLGETRSDIQETFAPCPHRCILLASRLGGELESAKFRVQRAWLAGQWARAVLDKRVGSPNKSVQLALSPKIYVILQAPGIDNPVCFRSSGSYWSALGGRHGDSISHSFPSETEAKVYVESAGFEFPSIQP